MEKGESQSLLKHGLRLVQDQRAVWLTRRLWESTKKNNPAIAESLGQRFIYRDALPEGIEEIRIMPVEDVAGMGMMWSRVHPNLPHRQHHLGKSLWLTSTGVVHVSLDRYEGPTIDPQENPHTNFGPLLEADYSQYNLPLRVVANYLEGRGTSPLKTPQVSEVVQVVETHV